jgi:hypothetical protein
MGRSNLRAKAAYGGYNLVDVRTDSMIFSERTPGIITKAPWTKVKLEAHQYHLTKTYPRPSYKVNDSFPNVKAKWTYTSDANVISTPAVANGLVILETAWEGLMPFLFQWKKTMVVSNRQCHLFIACSEQ